MQWVKEQSILLLRSNNIQCNASIAIFLCCNLQT